MPAMEVWQQSPRLRPALAGRTVIEQGVPAYRRYSMLGLFYGDWQKTIDQLFLFPDFILQPVDVALQLWVSQITVLTHSHVVVVAANVALHSSALAQTFLEKVVWSLKMFKHTKLAVSPPPLRLLSCHKSGVSTHINGLLSVFKHKNNMMERKHINVSIPIFWGEGRKRGK